MIRIVKRSIAAISAGILALTSMAMPVFAAHSAYPTPHTRSFDFNGLTVADPADANSAFQSYFGNDTEFYQVLVEQGVGESVARNTYRYDAVDQVFGKEAGDKAMRIWIDGTKETYTGTDPMQKLILNDKNTESDLTRMNIQKGEYFDLSFDIAVDGGAGEKGVAMQYAGHDGRRYKIIQVTDTNVVKVFGMDTGKTIKAQKWYNFRLVIRAGDDAAADAKDHNYFWFYIDNQVIKRGIFKPTHDNGVQINCFTGFNYFWFYQYAFADYLPTEPTTFAERDLYLDNIKMESSTTTDCTLATGTYTVDNFAFEMNGSEIEDGGAFSMGTLNAKASLTVFDANTKLSVIAAQYRENTDKLLQFVMSDTLVIDGVVDPFDGSPATVTASLSVTETEGTYIKAFLWDMRNGNIIPISSTAIQLAGATSGEIFDLALQYPGYTNKAVTFSFDDGRPEDKKIIDELYTPYGISGTFNLNSNLQLLYNADDTKRAYVKELYKDQEVANHVKNHPHMGLTTAPADISVSMATDYIALIEAGVSELQSITGQEVAGMAWPYENPTLTATPYKDEAQKVDEYVKNSSSIAYARGGVTTGKFDVPTSFKDWQFTAYIAGTNITGLVDEFLALPDTGDLKLFSIWGHAYDLNENGNKGSLDNWRNNERYNQMKRLIEEGTSRNIWFATNIEYVRYVNATKMLETTKNTITNPSNQDIYLLVNYKPVKIRAGETFTLDEVTMNKVPTVYLAGDSTCEIVPESERPRTGWGEKLGDYLSVTVDDRAKATRSTKTFVNDIEVPKAGSAEYGMDRLQDILDSAKEGDYLFIQFGHNDSMSSRPLRYTTVEEYKTNLKSYVTRAREKGVQPVLLTSIRLCVFENGEIKVQDGIESYRNAMKEVASEMSVPLLDIGERWRVYLNGIGEDAAKELYMVSYNNTDTTHPRTEGAVKLAEMIAKEIKNNNAIGELSKYVK